MQGKHTKRQNFTKKLFLPRFTQYGIAFTDDVFGSVVQGNTLAGNTQAGLYLNSAQNLTVGGGVDGNGSLDISSSDFGVVAGGTLTDTQLSGNNIHDNMKAGIQLLAGAGLSSRLLTRCHILIYYVSLNTMVSLAVS